MVLRRDAVDIVISEELYLVKDPLMINHRKSDIKVDTHIILIDIDLSAILDRGPIVNVFDIS